MENVQARFERHLGDTQCKAPIAKLVAIQSEMIQLSPDF
jgi:hypothetical protein